MSSHTACFDGIVYCYYCVLRTYILFFVKLRYGYVKCLKKTLKRETKTNNSQYDGGSRFPSIIKLFITGERFSLLFN